MTCPISLENIPIRDDGQPLNRTYAIATPNGSQVYRRSNLTEHLRHRNWWPHAGAGAVIVPDNVRASLGLPPRGAGRTVDRNAVLSLHGAVINNDIESVRRLIANRANVDAVNSTGWTPLHWAAMHDHHDIVEFLLRSNANVNAVDHLTPGRTPLHVAAMHGHHDIVELLLRSNANIDAVYSYGQTPLHLAAWENRGDIINLLLRSGANVSIRNRNGMTARNRDRERLQLLHRQYSQYRNNTRWTL